MEVSYVEQDPKSAPIVIEPSNQKIVYTPDQNEKYPAHTGPSAYPLPEHVQQPVYPGPGNPQAQAELGTAGRPVPIYKKKWPWILAVVAFSVIVVAAVVGGVVGTQNANRSVKSSSTSNSGDTSSSAVASTTTSPSTTSTSTSASASASASSTSTPGTEMAMYPDDSCGDNGDIYNLKTDTSGCQVVPSAKRSILVRSNQGCNITTWSDKSCSSNPFLVKDSQCHNFPYAAVSYSC